MEFDIEHHGNITIVKLMTATLEMKNVSDFKCDIIPILKSNDNLIMDLSRIQFIDSSGCGALSFCQRTLKEMEPHKIMKICGVSKQIEATFRLIRFHRLFEIFDTKEGALKSFLGREL